MLRPFMKKKLREKMMQVTREELLAEIPEAMLPIANGGTLDFDQGEWAARHARGEFVTPQSMHREKIMS
jgi:hypothetical protein